MSFLSVEIKARCAEPQRIRSILQANDADYRGTDEQVDYYFNAPHGRLKLRVGKIENFLIHYERPNQAGPKASKVILYRSNPAENLRNILTAALGIKVVVEKQRAIFFIKNVKFHVDEVKGLGSFVEIEAQNKNADYTEEELQQQCNDYLQLLGIQPANLVTHSYSDLLMEREEH